MKLFQMDNHRLNIQPEAYTLIPFAKIWDRDRTKDKTTALAELAFVYYMCDYKSDFDQIVNKDDRAKEIASYLKLPKNYKADEDILDAMEFYNKRQKTVTMFLLEDVYSSIDKLRAYFREVDLLEYGKDGKPIHDVMKLTRSIEAVAKIVDSLRILEEKVKREKDETGLRAGRSKGMYEDAN